MVTVGNGVSYEADRSDRVESGKFNRRAGDHRLRIGKASGNAEVYRLEDHPSGFDKGQNRKTRHSLSNCRYSPNVAERFFRRPCFRRS